MGGVIKFEERAVARLRERLGAVEEANQDLIAFARGHSGAVASIHHAVLAGLEAEELEQLLAVVTRDWPAILGIDAVALGVTAGATAFNADGDGVRPLEPALLRRWTADLRGVEMRTVHRGHPLFGIASPIIGVEALVRLDSAANPLGLLALGQRSGQAIEARHGSDLLMFLGRSLSAMLSRWLTRPARPA